MSEKEEDELYYQIQKSLHEKKHSPETAMEMEIQHEAEQLEQKNYSHLKKSRIQLQGLKSKYEKTTDKLKTQGEKISKAKKASYNIQDKAKKAEDLADEIDRESKFFSFSFWSCCCTIFSSNKKSKPAPLSDITSENYKNYQVEESESESQLDLESDSKDEEYLKGEHKTNSELKLMLKTIRSIKKESATQASLINMQKNDLSEVQRINEKTKSKVKSVSKFLEGDKST